MKYVTTAIVPAKCEVQFIENSRWSLSLTKEIVFIVLFEKGDVILFIVNTANKSFGVVQTHSKKQTNYFAKFLTCIKTKKKEWIATSYENPNIASDKYNVELYIIENIRQYMESSTLKKSTVSPEEIRKQLKKTIIESSANMKLRCLYCGTKDTGDWGKCTSCFRWLHSVCAGIPITEFKKLKHYKCPICVQFF